MEEQFYLKVTFDNGEIVIPDLSGVDPENLVLIEALSGWLKSCDDDCKSIEFGKL